MSTQQTNANRHTDGFKPGRISRFQPSSLPLFQSSSLLALLAASMLAGTARGAEYFVATNGNDSNGGTGWGDALLTISAALAKGDVTIVTVSNGTYNISATIAISAGITVRSFGNGVYGGLTNASNTVVSGGHGTFSVFTISHANAAVNGLTIRDGENIGHDPYINPKNTTGGGVNMSAGLVSECIISGNAAATPGKGGGVYISNGTVSNCLITANGAGCVYGPFYGNHGSGNGIYMDGGLVTHCRIIDHKVSMGETASRGGGVYMNAGTLRNCLVAGNEGSKFVGEYGSIYDSYGGGVYMTGGAIESCTIVTNSIGSGSPSLGTGGGVYWTGGTVTNSVIFANFDRTTGATNNYYGLTSANTAYSCTTPALGGSSNISDDPLFANAAGGDYTLQKTSHCIDAGANQAWMSGAKDLAGNNRLIKGNKAGPAIVDMGAYETYVPPKGTMVTLR